MNFKEFSEKLRSHSPEKIIFVVLGNKLRSDDAAGIIIGEKLKRKNPFSESYFIDAGTNPENYLETILDIDAEAVVFIDSANWQDKPGTIKWLDSEMIDKTAFSTHTFSIKLIEQYLLMEKDLKFYYLGVQAEDTGPGTILSESVNLGITKFFYDEMA